VDESQPEQIRVKHAKVKHEENIKPEAEQEEEDREILSKKILIAAHMDEDAEEKKYDEYEAPEQEEELKWDCETILSTYTNTDNHPGVIKTQRRVKAGDRMKIELHKQFKVPIDGLIPLAEEITIQKEKRDALGKTPFQRVAVAGSEKKTEKKEEAGEEITEENDKTVNEKKQRKKQ